MSTWYLEAQTIAGASTFAGEPCEMVQSADDLYVGEVVGLAATVHPNSSRPFSTSVRFAVLERFKAIGVISRGFETLTSDDFSKISVGQRYLVYVRSPGPEESFIYADRIATLIPLGKAQLVLDYVRSPLRTIGEINGYVEDTQVASTALFSWAPNWAYSLVQTLFPVDLQQKLLRGARLRLDSKDQSPRLAVSNGRGRFRFGDLKPGSYQLSVDDPHLVLRTIDSQVRVVPGGCIDLYLKPLVTPVVTGRVIRDGGLPRFGLSAHLLAYGQANSSTSPYAAEIHGPGWFEFSAVTPGDYLLTADAPSVPPLGEPLFRRYFYPGVSSEQEATRIRVAAGSRLTTVTFQLPPLQRRR